MSIRKSVTALALVTVTAMTISLTSASPASAYQCLNRATGISAMAKGTIIARAKARQKWVQHVKSTKGLAWSVWAIAKHRSIRCQRAAGATRKVRCLAKANPCKYVVQ